MQLNFTLFNDSIILRTTIGGINYSVTYKLFFDEDQFEVFCQSCHEFLVRVWRLMGWFSFMESIPHNCDERVWM